MSERQIKVNAIRCASIMACRSGAAAAEFALIVPVLMLVMFGTFQTSLLMYSYNVMVSSARDTARAMAVCTITDGNSADGQAQKSRPAWIGEGDWRVTSTFGDDVTVKIEVDPKIAAVVNFLPFGFGTLTAYAEMRKEPLAFGGSNCSGSVT